MNGTLSTFVLAAKDDTQIPKSFTNFADGAKPVAPLFAKLGAATIALRILEWLWNRGFQCAHLALFFCLHMVHISITHPFI